MTANVRRLMCGMLSAVAVACAHPKLELHTGSAEEQLVATVDDLAEQYSANLRHNSDDTTLVVSCLGDRRGSNARLCTDVAARLTRALFRRGVRVVEAERAEDLVAEQQRQLSAPFDEGRAMKLGKLLGASELGLGTTAMAGNLVTLSFRFLSVETGLMVSIAESSVLGSTAEALYPENQAGDTFLLTSVEVEVELRKPDGFLWDAQGTYEDPDLYVRVQFGRNKPVEFEAQDTLTARWTPEPTNDSLFVYDDRDPIVISVTDLDISLHDSVGSITFEHGLPAQALQRGVYSAPHFGQVKSFVVRFAKR